MVVKKGDRVKVQYTGRLEDGTIFAKSEAGEPLEFTVGSGQIISGFDKMRREIARRALERLLEDGRIHPGRIEEVVEKVKKEIESTIKEEDIEDQQDLEVSTELESSQPAINPDKKPLARLPNTVNLHQKKPTPPMTPQQSPEPAFSEREVLDILQLPSGIQQELPEFIIAAHVYSKKPPSRLVSINGRILRQGHTLSPGLKVEEIAPDGVIFSYEDYFFKVGVF